jgi:hypothetical protein
MTGKYPSIAIIRRGDFVDIELHGLAAELEGKIASIAFDAMQALIEGRTPPEAIATGKPERMCLEAI